MIVSQSNETTTPLVLLVSRDLMTTSSVGGAAAACGGRVEVLADLATIGQRATDPACRCIILELSPGGVNPADLMSRLPQQNRPHVIAFGSHVATGLLEAAETAGCDQVLSRGKFTATMAGLLKQRLDTA